MNPSDVQLPELLAADLDHHFHQLVQSYQSQLYAFLLRQTGNSQDAEDIVQEVFIRAYYALAGYPGERVRTIKLRAWLFKIALNTLYSPGWKSRLLCVPLDLSDDSVLLTVEDDGCEQPELIAENKDRLRELEALVSTLPDRYRVAVNLYYFEDLSYQEMADLLGQPIGTVKSNVFRGVRLLRAALETQKR